MRIRFIIYNFIILINLNILSAIIPDGLKSPAWAIKYRRASDIMQALEPQDMHQIQQSLEAGLAEKEPVPAFRVITPLSGSINLKRPEVTEFLLENNAPQKTEDGVWTEMHEAAETNADTTIEVLLKFGARLDVKCHCGRTPLHETAIQDAYLAAQVLIDNLANLNVQDNQGLTPLHRAIICKASKVTELLICYGADIIIKNNAGETIIDLDMKFLKNIINKISKDRKEAKKYHKYLIKQKLVTEELSKPISLILEFIAPGVTREITALESICQSTKLPIVLVPIIAEYAAISINNYDLNPEEKSCDELKE